MAQLRANLWIKKVVYVQSVSLTSLFHMRNVCVYHATVKHRVFLEIKVKLGHSVSTVSLSCQ